MLRESDIEGRESRTTSKASVAAGTLKITRITHSCTLIDVGGSVLLADPWFSEKFGYHRGEALGMRPADLPPLAGVLVSHAHYDHDDVEAIAGTIDPNVPFIVEAGAVESARKAGFSNVSALAPWESARLVISNARQPRLVAPSHQHRPAQWTARQSVVFEAKLAELIQSKERRELVD